MGIASPTHLIIVMIIVLLLFGAKRIPELARGLGSGMRELQKGVSALKTKQVTARTRRPRDDT